MKKLIFILLFIITSCDMEKDVLITINTPYGDMKAILFEETPLHKQNFIKLTKEEKFNSTIFHRVIKDFMIQGGDVNLKGDPNAIDYTIPAEFNDKFFHSKGSLAAARMGDNVNPKKKSSGCQFYIVDGSIFTKDELSTDIQSLFEGIQLLFMEPEYSDLKDKFLKVQNDRKETQKLAMQFKNVVKEKFDISTSIDILPEKLEAYSSIGGSPHLDGEYTVFGRVVEGLDVIDKIATVKTGQANKPIEDIQMKVSLEMVKKDFITKNYGYQYPTGK
mgnify:FL=1